MNSMMPEKDFPYDKDTLVVLIARCAEGHAIIEQHGNPLGGSPTAEAVSGCKPEGSPQGWLYLRSSLLQHRFVHVLNDRLFDVVFITKDRVNTPSSKRKEKRMSDDRFYLKCPLRREGRVQVTWRPLG